MIHALRLLPLIVLITLGDLALAPTPGLARTLAPFEAALRAGKTDEAERLLSAQLIAQSADDNARFALGMVQFFGAVERRVQAFHRHGFRPGAGIPGVTGLPIPPNTKPEPLDAPTARKLLQGWVDDLARVEATLAPIKADVKVPLHFGLIRLDFDGDGQAGDGETLWKIFQRFRPDANVTPEIAQGFVISFDRGDVDWLRGYCHLLSALTEFLLGHDFAPLVDRSAFLLFGGAKPPNDFLTQPEGKPDEANMMGIISDYVALIHAINLPVAEPARLKAALVHLEATVTLNRSSWRSILAEADNDHEWIPSPKQDTVLPAGKVTDEMIQTWNEFLDEFEAILQGKKLIPFWRGKTPELGLNFRRVLAEPRPFDLVLWVQGTGAAPYLEIGTVTSPDTWQRINRVFRGEFVGYAIWFN